MMLLAAPISAELYNVLSANKVDRFHKPPTDAAAYLWARAKAEIGIGRIAALSREIGMKILTATFVVATLRVVLFEKTRFSKRTQDGRFTTRTIFLRAHFYVFTLEGFYICMYMYIM